MYIIIKRDKAESLKAKMHAIKAAALEVLGCIEEAESTHYNPPYYDESRTGADPYRDGMRNDGYVRREGDYPISPEYDPAFHDHARRGTRGRYR